MSFNPEHPERTAQQLPDIHPNGSVHYLFPKDRIQAITDKVRGIECGIADWKAIFLEGNDPDCRITNTLQTLNDQEIVAYMDTFTALEGLSGSEAQCAAMLKLMQVIALDPLKKDLDL